MTNHTDSTVLAWLSRLDTGHMEAQRRLKQLVDDDRDLASEMEDLRQQRAARQKTLVEIQAQIEHVRDDVNLIKQRLAEG